MISLISGSKKEQMEKNERARHAENNLRAARAEEVGGIGDIGERDERYKVSVMSQEWKVQHREHSEYVIVTLYGNGCKLHISWYQHLKYMIVKLLHCIPETRIILYDNFKIEKSKINKTILNLKVYFKKRSCIIKANFKYTEKNSHTYTWMQMHA